MTQVFQVAFDGIAFGAALALVSVGLTLVFGILRVVNFAHGVMFMLGAYVTYYLTARAGVSYFIAVVAAGGALALGSAGVAGTVFRRFRGLQLEGAIAAIALALMLESLALVVFGGQAKQVNSPFSSSVLDVGGVRIADQKLFVIVVAIAVIVALRWFVSATRYGRALRAVQQDPDTARLQGIDVDRMTVLAFSIGGALAGFAGALVAPQQALFPSMGSAFLLLAFVVIILGGMGSVVGALVAALLVGLLQSAVATYWLPQATTWTSFAMVLLLLTMRPQGLFGTE
jgi:branched-chain amino acid transport system permease protein